MTRERILAALGLVLGIAVGIAAALALSGCTLTLSHDELMQVQRSELYHAHMAGFGQAGLQ